MKPLISVVTVCMNDLEGLIQTRDSVMAQTFCDFEWLVIDGGSTDGTYEFLLALSGNYNARWISESDDGLYDAMNKGIEIATGRYLIFMNSGDEFASDSVLQDVVNNINKDTIPDLIYGDSLERSKEHGIVYKPARNYKHIWYGMFTHHQSIFYRKSRLGKIRYRCDYLIAADYALTSEFLGVGINAIYLDIPICIFEGGGITSKSINHLRGIKEQWKVGRNILKRSRFLCTQTALLHILKHIFRRLLPSLHLYLRYRRQ